MQLVSIFSLLFGFVLILQPGENQAFKIEENKEQSASHSISRREVSSDLMFPEDNPHPPKVSLRRAVDKPLKPSPCPEDAIFCEEADDYPSEHIQDLLAKQKNIGPNFYVEIEAAAEVERFGNHDETSLCPSVTKTVYPKKGQSREGVLEFIVNEENYKQGIKVEVCLKDGNACDIPGSLSNGYTSHCRQKNILRTLVVVNKNISDVDGFITKPFEFPSCCACMITNLSADRFGYGYSQKNTTAKG